MRHIGASSSHWLNCDCTHHARTTCHTLYTDNPEWHLLHVPLPAFSCTSTPCTTYHPQQTRWKAASMPDTNFSACAPYEIWPRGFRCPSLLVVALYGCSRHSYQLLRTASELTPPMVGLVMVRWTAVCRSCHTSLAQAQHTLCYAGLLLQLTRGGAVSRGAARPATPSC